MPTRALPASESRKAKILLKSRIYELEIEIKEAEKARLEGSRKNEWVLKFVAY